MKKQKIKIIGIRPPAIDLILQDYPDTEKNISVVPRRAKVPSLGLFYVGTIIENELKNLGYSVEIKYFDMAASKPNNIYPYSKEFASYSEVLYGKGKIIKRLRGENLSKIKEIVDGFDLCFISSLLAAESSSVAQVFKTIKKTNPNIFCLTGGRDAQFRPEWYLANGADVVFLGQAEKLCGKIIDSLIKNKPLNFDGIATSEKIGVMGKKIKINTRCLLDNGVSSIKNYKNEISRDSLLEQDILPNFDKKIISYYTESCDGKLPKDVYGPVMWYRTSVGCPNGCDFCPSSASPYFSLSPERVEKMLRHYKKYGINVLLSAEDNFLARFLNKNKPEEETENEIINIMQIIRKLGFAHEFSNGLQVGLLVDKNNRVRTKLINELFKCQKTKQGKIIGTYRTYWPIEDLVNRTRLGKLANRENHYKIIDAVLQTGIPEIVFNTIIFTDYTKKDVENLEKELDFFCSWMEKHQRQTKWSIPIFHELPLPGARNYQKLLPQSFDINKHSELWAVPINPTNGTHYKYHELYSIKRKLMRKFDPEGLKSWDTQGRYGTTHHKK